MEGKLTNRRAKYLKRAAECDAKAAKTGFLRASELWTVAARTWREMATSCELAAQAEQAKNVKRGGPNMSLEINGTNQAEDLTTIETMARYGITNVPVASFHYREYRYTNLKDAMAQAERDRLNGASNTLLQDSKPEVGIKSAMPKPSIVLQPDQLAVSISCPKCGQQGLAVVEKTSSPAEGTLEFTLVSLPESFYHRLSKLRPHRIETVCFSCGGLLPPLAYDGAALLAAANASE